MQYPTKACASPGRIRNCRGPRAKASFTCCNEDPDPSVPSTSKPLDRMHDRATRAGARFFFDTFSGSRATNAGSIECRARARELIRKAPKEKENRGIMWCYACILVPAADCFDRLRRCQKAFGGLFRSSRSLACTEWLMLIGRDDDER